MSPIVYDVAIIGAGPAGIAAAIGAARQGAHVRLVERDITVGGNATTAMVGTVCGLARCGAHAPRPPRFDNPGFAAEFSKRVATASGTTLTIDDDGLAYLPYRIPSLNLVASEMLKESQGVNLTTLAMPTAISRQSPTLPFEITVQHHDRGVEELRAKTIIDATGSALMSRLLNLPTATPAHPQAASLIFELSNLPPLSERLLGITTRKLLMEASAENALPKHLSFISIVPGSLRESCALFKLGTLSSETEGDSDVAYAKALAGIPLLISTLRDRSDEFKDVQHSRSAPRLGVRGGMRGIGEEELSEAAVRLSQRHIKGIALGLWPAEMWSSPARPIVSFPEQGDSYEIPLGSLCARSTPGVYFAGRAISASDYAIASARVIGTCLSTGYAAGRLAAGSLQGESENLIISRIREEQVYPFYEMCAQ